MQHKALAPHAPAVAAPPVHPPLLLTHSSCLLVAVARVCCRLAVFHRLYQQAVALRQKMENRREDIKKNEIESILQNKTTMSWISSEMMRDRSAGPFDNYGEMLYAESLESLARKRDKVGEQAAAAAAVLRVHAIGQHRAQLRSAAGPSSTAQVMRAAQIELLLPF